MYYDECTADLIGCSLTPPCITCMCLIGVQDWRLVTTKEKYLCDIATVLRLRRLALTLTHSDLFSYLKPIQFTQWAYRKDRV